MGTLTKTSMWTVWISQRWQRSPAFWIRLILHRILETGPVRSDIRRSPKDGTGLRLFLRGPTFPLSGKRFLCKMGASKEEIVYPVTDEEAWLEERARQRGVDFSLYR